jgi:D-3-phosphoglycerate dehydrogenase / 2-oxoglutarate reductase
MRRVMVGPAILTRGSGAYFDELTRAGFEPFYPARKAQMTEDEIIAQEQGLHFVLAGSEPYSRRVLDQLPSLRVLARAGVGYDAVDVAACTEKGIAVCYAPNTNNEAVAEQALLYMLALSKKMYEQDQKLRAGEWPRKAYGSLRNKTVGIVGIGRVGRQVALRAQAFRMNVIACDPYVDGSFARTHGIPLMSMEEVCRQSDFVTLHTPGTPLTTRFINRESLAWLKPSAFLINTSRGTVVHEPDLVECLQARRIAGAGLDVFDDEPLSASHPFTKLDNVLLTAHTAGVDEQSIVDMGHVAAKAIVALARGDWPEEWIVNPEVKERFFCLRTPPG